MRYNAAPLDVDNVLDTRWLSHALSIGRDPVQVTDFTVEETLGPSALKIRLALTYAQPHTELPDRLCVKGIFDPNLKAWLSSGAQQAEALFYRDVAPRLSLRVPRSYYSGFDPETMAGLVIMEDLVPLGAQFLSATSPYTPDQMRKSLDQLARLHGGSWAADSTLEPWINSKLRLFASGRIIESERLTELLHDQRGEGLDPRVRDGKKLLGAVNKLDERDAGLPACFIHGDTHAGNLYEMSGEIGLIDWQVLQRGHWSLDVAYHIAAALDIEDRRKHERELLAYYCEQLAQHGGTPPDTETAWRQYREAISYGLLMWGMTQRVEPAIIRLFVSRLGTAISDHDSFALLGLN